MSELTIRIEGIDPVDFLGINNSRLKLLKKAFPRLKIVSRGDQIKTAGQEEDIDRLKGSIERIVDHIERFGKISESQLESILFNEESIIEESANMKDQEVLVYGSGGNIVRARTPNQKKLVEAVNENDVVFAVGPAGTGKTYTAVALAVRALKEKQVRRIILTRPAVEAGENLGFLPGDLKEKIDPYLRPLYDALDDMIPSEKLNYLNDNRTIEIAPLAFMRGRTLDKAFIILDEAQNATSAQLKMFLTRIGPQAKCIITGDMTQIDLPRSQRSGLGNAIDILKDIRGIGVVRLSNRDVIRHPLVKKIIDAYEGDTEKNKPKKEAENGESDS